jgi:hypothetical protein
MLYLLQEVKDGDSDYQADEHDAVENHTAE